MVEKKRDNQTPLIKYHNLLICLGLIIITLVVYWPATEYGLISFDDQHYVTDNRYVKQGITRESIMWAFTTTQAANWHPLTWLSLMLDIDLYGTDPGGIHLTNILFHSANTVLLFLVFSQITGAIWKSAFVAALFSLHPLHVESVVWISERKDVLSTFFWFLTMGSYVRYVKRPGLIRYLMTIICFSLGLMTKPMLVTMPFVLLLLDYWPLRRLESNRLTGNCASITPAIIRLVREKIPFFIVMTMSIVVTFWVQKSAGAVGTLELFPLHIRLANVFISYVAYIAKTVWPYPLAFFYPYPLKISWWKAAAALMLLLTIFSLVFREKRRRPYLSIGWLWYAGTLVPVIGLVQVGSQAMADRYTYIPAVGIFIMVAWGFEELVTRWRFSKTVIVSGIVLVFSIFSVTTRFQIRHWRDSIALYTHAIAVTTDNYVAHLNLASTYSDQNKLEKAIRHYSEVLRFKPKYVKAHNNLGLVMAKKGRFEEAVRYYSEALRLKQNYPEAHNNLGSALAQQDRLPEAIKHYTEALRLRPNYAEAHNNFANVLAKQGNISEAIRHYSAALTHAPGFEEARRNMETVLAIAEKNHSVVNQWIEKVRKAPGDAEAHYHLGNALSDQGRMAEAIRHYSEALRIDPEFDKALYNLGLALAQEDRTTEAIEKLKSSLKRFPDDPILLHTLGLMYQKQGALDSAINHYLKVLSIRPEFTLTLNNLAMVYVQKNEDEKALELFKKLSGLLPDDEKMPYNVACMYARLNRVGESLEWLQKAIEQGYKNWEFIKTDQDLKNIRESLGYRDIVKNH